MASFYLKKIYTWKKKKSRNLNEDPNSAIRNYRNFTKYFINCFTSHTPYLYIKRGNRFYILF